MGCQSQYKLCDHMHESDNPRFPKKGDKVVNKFLLFPFISKILMREVHTCWNFEQIEYRVKKKGVKYALPQLEFNLMTFSLSVGYQVHAWCHRIEDTYTEKA